MQIYSEVNAYVLPNGIVPRIAAFISYLEIMAEQRWGSEYNLVLIKSCFYYRAVIDVSIFT